jgi:hypothetical protein
MLATMANSLTALGKDGALYEKSFRDLAPSAWEVDTFEQGKKYASDLARNARVGAQT